MSIDYYRVFVRKIDYGRAAILWKEIQTSSEAEEK